VSEADVIREALEALGPHSYSRVYEDALAALVRLESERDEAVALTVSLRAAWRENVDYLAKKRTGISTERLRSVPVSWPKP